MCYIADGKAGACDRCANHGGDLIRLDPLTIIQTGDQKLVPFLWDQGDQDTWDGDIIKGDRPFITAVAQARPIQITNPPFYRQPED